MNKMFMKAISLLIAMLLFFSIDVQAHEGHDHSHQLSWLLHAVWALSILALGYIAFLLVSSRMQSALKIKESNDAL